MISRRRFSTLSASAAALSAMPFGASQAARINSTYRGVKLGLITGSLNPQPPAPDRDPIDVIIEQCVALGAANIELVSVGGQTPPAVVNGGRFGQVPDQVTPEYLQSREVLRQWRIAQPLDRYQEVRRKFARAGLHLFSYVWTVSDDYTDAEIDAGFRQLRALGVKMFTTNQTRATMGAKIAPFAEEYRIQTAWHPHSNVTDAREVATPEGMERLLDVSKSFVINLDIGHYTAGNNDAVAFLRKHHRRITHLHIKDRKREQGPNVQLGTGDTPVAECLRLIRDNRWPIYAVIEREYRDAPGTPVEQTRWQMEYMRRALST